MNQKIRNDSFKRICSEESNQLSEVPVSISK